LTELSRSGETEDLARARQRLVRFEEMQKLHIANRDFVARELARVLAAGDH
jgi:hypothetical protein